MSGVIDLILSRLASPVGEILLVHDGEERLRALDFHDYEDRMHRLLRLHYGTASLRAGTTPTAIANSLRRYFDGDLDAPAAISVETAGTPFQRKVWTALRTIRAGETQSYGSLAQTISAPKAFRAVGLANGSNPVAIVVPCHRVIGASGSLTGFGGGLHRKRWLLEHEGVGVRG